MIAEYAAYFGAVPAADAPWPLVQALTDRIPRFEARRQLTFRAALGSALAAMFSTDAGAGQVELEKLVRTAYPSRGALQPMENQAAPPEPEDESDG